MLLNLRSRFMDQPRSKSESQILVETRDEVGFTLRLLQAQTARGA
jgi:hypothetical protein